MGDSRYKERAEQIARADQADLERLTRPEVEAMLHEIKVQRIAAELQNEELRVARNNLEQSRNEFRELFEAAPVGYVVLDRRGIIHRANRVFADLTESDPLEDYGKPFVRFLREEDRHVFLSRFRAMYQMPEGKSLVARLCTPADEPTVVRLELSRMKGFAPDPPADEVADALLVITDITESRRQQRALEESTDRYRVLFESGVDAKFVHGFRDDGSPTSFTDVNRVACEQLGYTREELLALGPPDIDSRDSAARIPRYTEELRRRGSIIFEAYHVAKDGREIPVEISAHLFNLGTKPTVLSVARDITLRKREEAALKLRTGVYQVFIEESGAQLYGALLGHVLAHFERPFGWLALATHCETLDVVAETCGRAGDGVSIAGRSVGVDECGWLVQASYYSKELAVGSASVERPLLLVEPGAGVAVYGVALPLAGKDRLVGHLLVADDRRPFSNDEVELLAELAAVVAPMLIERQELDRQEALRRQAEQQIAASLKEKEVLLREVHHRVKNNLQVVASLLSMTAEQSKDSEIASVLETSRSRVYAMALIHQTLYSTDDLSHIDLLHYTSRLLTAMQTALLAGKNITVEADVEPIALDIDHAIPVGLIINELVSNSIKHAFAGNQTGHIWVSARTAGDVVRIAVEDDGVGMGKRRAGRGSLGLLLVDVLTDQVGGTLDVTSEGGTKTVLTLPLDP